MAATAASDEPCAGPSTSGTPCLAMSPTPIALALEARSDGMATAGPLRRNVLTGDEAVGAAGAGMSLPPKKHHRFAKE
jgi:hypothetical protein